MRLSTTQPISPYVRHQHTTNPDSAARHSCIHLARRDTFQPGAINTTKQAVYLPVRKVFSCPKFIVLDVGRAYPQGWPHNLFCGVDSTGLKCITSRQMYATVPRCTVRVCRVLVLDVGAYGLGGAQSHYAPSNIVTAVSACMDCLTR